MKKKGFTLVELLVVIAMISFLALLALPNIMGSFFNVKKRAFMIETKEVYRTALYSWQDDKVLNPNGIEYGKCDNCTYRILPLNGREEVNYYAKLNEKGCVTKLIVDDGTYRFEYSGECMLGANIQENLITSSKEEFNTKEYVYANNTTEINLGSTIPAFIKTYSTYNELVNDTGNIMFLRYGLSNDKVDNISLGFVYNNNAYYLDSSSSFEDNKAIIQSVFDSNYCYSYDSPKTYTCLDSNEIGPNIDENGWIAYQDGKGLLCYIEKHVRTSVIFSRCTFD